LIIQFLKQLEIEEEHYMIIVTILGRTWHSQLIDTDSHQYITMKNDVESQVFQFQI